MPKGKRGRQIKLRTGLSQGFKARSEGVLYDKMPHTDRNRLGC